MVAKQSKPQWGFEAANGLAAGKMEGPRPDKFAGLWLRGNGKLEGK